MPGRRSLGPLNHSWGRQHECWDEITTFQWKKLSRAGGSEEKTHNSQIHKGKRRKGREEEREKLPRGGRRGGNDGIRLALCFEGMAFLWCNFTAPQYGSWQFKVRMWLWRFCESQKLLFDDWVVISSFETEHHSDNWWVDCDLKYW